MSLSLNSLQLQNSQSNYKDSLQIVSLILVPQYCAYGTAVIIILPINQELKKTYMLR